MIYDPKTFDGMGFKRRVFRAKVVIRRKKDMAVKPEVEGLDGKEILVRERGPVLGIPAYEGEIWMEVPPYTTIETGINSIASGDLQFIEEVKQ